MKKTLILLIAVSLLAGILGIYPNIGKSAVMEGITLDQKNEQPIQGLGMTISNYGKGQTFKPEFNILTGVEVYLMNRMEGGQIMATIKNSNGQTVATSEVGTMVQAGLAPNTWETLNFASPYGPLIPGQTYQVILTCLLNNQTSWGYNLGNHYANGQAVGGANPASEDFLFRTYGKLESASLSADHPAAGSTPSQNQVSVSQNIALPTLSYVLKNNEKIEAPIEKVVLIKEKDKLKVFGKSTAGYSVVLFTDSDNYSGTVDKNGEWSIEIDTDKLTGDKEITIQGQAQTPEAKGSEIADLFKVKKITEKPVTKTEPRTFLQKLLTDYFLYLVAALVVLLIGLTVLLYYLTKKREALKPLEKKPIEKIADAEKPKKKIKIIQN